MPVPDISAKTMLKPNAKATINRAWRLLHLREARTPSKFIRIESEPILRAETQFAKSSSFVAGLGAPASIASSANPCTAPHAPPQRPRRPFAHPLRPRSCTRSLGQHCRVCSALVCSPSIPRPPFWLHASQQRPKGQACPWDRPTPRSPPSPARTALPSQRATLLPFKRRASPSSTHGHKHDNRTDRFQGPEILERLSGYGVGYGDYLEQLTYLTSLKMAEEYSSQTA